MTDRCVFMLSNQDMKHLLIVVLLFGWWNAAPAQTRRQPLPTGPQLAWADKEIGVIIHLDIPIFLPDSFDYDRKETLPALSVFHPSKLNTDQWIRAASEAGAKYAILVAKHSSGFSLWPTRQYDYHIGHTLWKDGHGDVVADFIRSCKKYGVSPGIYCSTGFNTYLGVHNNDLHSPDSMRAYNKIVLGQLTELWTQYGKLFEIWFDGGVLATSKGGISDEAAALVKRYQPQAILFQGPSSCDNLIRWVGNESGKAPYPLWSRADAVTASNGVVEIKDLHGDPNGAIWCTAESDFPNRQKSAWGGGWFWKAGEEDKVLSANELFQLYYSTVGNNSNMLIGMAIDTSGSFPAADEARFAGFGRMVRERFGKAVGATSGAGNEVELQFAAPVKVNHIVLMEDQSKGENVRSYVVEALVDDRWQEIAMGISIGHKRIQRIPEVEAARFRLRVIDAAQTPAIRRFALYDF